MFKNIDNNRQQQITIDNNRKLISGLRKLVESVFSRTTGDFNDFDDTPLPNNRSTARNLFDDTPLPAQVRQYKLNKEPNLRVQCTVANT